MKIQIQRVGRSDHYNAHKIDSVLMEGTIKGGIKKGQPLDVQFSHLDAGMWHTTKVVKVERLEDDTIFAHTKNSIYRIVKGWRD